MNEQTNRTLGRRPVNPEGMHYNDWLGLAVDSLVVALLVLRRVALLSRRRRATRQFSLHRRSGGVWTAVGEDAGIA